MSEWPEIKWVPLDPSDYEVAEIVCRLMDHWHKASDPVLRRSIERAIARVTNPMMMAVKKDD